MNEEYSILWGACVKYLKRLPQECDLNIFDEYMLKLMYRKEIEESKKL